MTQVRSKKKIVYDVNDGDENGDMISDGINNNDGANEREKFHISASWYFSSVCGGGADSCNHWNWRKEGEISYLFVHKLAHMYDKAAPTFSLLSKVNHRD